jgi:hypothetical protein
VAFRLVTPAENERGPKLGGGPDDLSHSIRGVAAHQGVSERGKADTFKTPTKIKF